ncbi:phosphotransferase family protein [Streptomyces mangrovisoli]|uniref:Phosphotransferase family protein n=1 Tax=Streptomyces mangrovisoli TaxID=1428628 RepID=A0A1J4NSW2_9ACTN|nr:phosphotransferase family protein [Streptomyces mangrovisoli]OIJ65577.1 phosphotransferase family protein [Streptomyces mangrovisoli]
MTTAPRPRTTTRDPEDLGRRLTAWLGTRLPGARAAHVRVPAANGLSSETLLFDIEHPEPPLRACALRLAADPAAYTVFPEYDMARQFRTMRLVADRTDVPVPRVLWLEEDPEPLGAPFFVMERVEGRVPPDVMPYTYEGNWLHAASDAQRAHLEAASVGVLARLHDQVPLDELEFLALPGEGDALRRHVESQRAYYAWVVDGVARSPLIEDAFARLEHLWPAESGRTVLSWGDARIGNIVYDGFDPVAVLDWEMAAPAPREVDLGWTIYLHRFFQDLTAAFGQAGLPELLRRDRVEERYARLTGHRPRDMEFHTLYAALRHAIVMLRIAYRQVHFGEIAVPADPDTLILHHGTLRAMVQGSYWS